MEKPADFRVVKGTRFGAESERNIDDKGSSDNEKIDVGRRKFLKFGAGVVTGVALGPALSPVIKHTYNEINKKESIEDGEEESAFHKEIEGYKTFVKLRKDQVLFVDEFNMPVGEPRSFEDFIIYKRATERTVPNQIRSDGTVAYKLTPGKIDEKGLMHGGISGEWLNYMEEKVQSDNPDQRIVRCLHPTTDFESAYNEADEPDLVDSISKGETNRYIDIVKYFAQKDVNNVPGRERAEYVKNDIKFSEDLPEVVQLEMRKLLPGLCAQESKFNAGVTSSHGAKGVMQFMPETWIDEKGDINKITWLKEQVEIAGKYISKQYKWIQQFAGAKAMDILRNKFDDEDSFQKDLMVPLLVNAYNVGAGSMGEVVKLFTESVQVNDMPFGKDLFVTIANFAELSNSTENLSNYKKDAREYVTRIYAQAEVLMEEGVV